MLLINLRSFADATQTTSKREGAVFTVHAVTDDN